MVTLTTIIHFTDEPSSGAQRGSVSPASHSWYVAGPDLKFLRDSRAWAVAAPRKLSLAPSSLPCHVLPTPLGPGGGGCTSKGIRYIGGKPVTKRRSDLERTTIMFFKKGSLPQGREGGVENVTAWFWLLQCLGHYWVAKLSHPACKRLTNKTVAQKMPKTPLLRNSRSFHSADEERKGRFA